LLPLLTSRRHIDLGRTSSAICRPVWDRPQKRPASRRTSPRPRSASRTGRPSTGGVTRALPWPRTFGSRTDAVKSHRPLRHTTARFTARDGLPSAEGRW